MGNFQTSILQDLCYWYQFDKIFLLLLQRIPPWDVVGERKIGTQKQLLSVGMIQKIVLELIEGPIVFIENVQVQPPDLFTNWRAKIATFIGTPHLLDVESEPLATWLDMDMETFGLKAEKTLQIQRIPKLVGPFMMIPQ